MKGGWTSEELFEALRTIHHTSPREWLLLKELRTGTGYDKNATQRLDAWAMTETLARIEQTKVAKASNIRFQEHFDIIGRLAEIQERLALPAGHVPNVQRNRAKIGGHTATLDDLGVLVLAERRRNELSTRQAAKAIGISPATLSRVERGGLPTIPHYVLFCQWLGIAPGDLLESLEP